jgi:hypothetical protein
MAEVAELYEANIELQLENNKLREKLQKGTIILDSNEGHNDSMNVDSELEDEGSFIKNGSYTNNDELGNSHFNETIGSIHNWCIDPASESYIEGIKREIIAKVKPEIIPVLNFAKLNRPDLVPSLKVKNYSMSNRTMNERISFTIEDDDDESQLATPESPDKVFYNIAIEQKHNAISQNKVSSGNHIMIEDVHDNDNDNSHQYESNMSKAQISWFANSSEATKKKSYSK